MCEGRDIYSQSRCLRFQGVPCAGAGTGTPDVRAGAGAGAPGAGPGTAT